LFFTRGFYRQEENIYLASSSDDVLSWSPEAQRVMGFELSSPNIGFVGFQSPVDYLRGASVGNSFGDFDPSQERRSKEP
jgi:ectoine hydroxylase-related dioxygenase (phytanoyl-CoA dioxygenase family)